MKGWLHNIIVELPWPDGDAKYQELLFLVEDKCVNIRTSNLDKNISSC